MSTRAFTHPLLIVPGLSGSGAGHWQAHWADRFDDARQITQDDWDHPDLIAWLSNLRAAVSDTPDAILVGHSLGSVLIAHFARTDPRAAVAGAMLVAPADIETCSTLPDCLAAFGPMPRERLPFPSITVASTNDPYMTISRAEEFARAWGSDFHNVGACGHINIAAGFGPWAEGKEILAELRGAIDASNRFSPAARRSGRAQPDTFIFQHRS